MAESTGETPKPTTQSVDNANEILSQGEGEQFDAKRAMELIAKLRGEIKELKPRAKQAEELAAAQKARDEAEMTESQKLSKRLAETEAALRTERRNATAAGVAARVGLPGALAGRLQGETPEEMEADARAILEALPKAAAPTEKPKTPGPINPGANGQTGESPAERKTRLYGDTADIWAPRANGIDWTALKRE